MAYWGVTTDDIKMQLPILSDTQVAGTWTDTMIEDAINEAYEWTRAQLRANWHERYTSWDSANDAGRTVQRLIVYASVVIMIMRMRARNSLTKEYEGLAQEWERVRDAQLQGILSGYLYIDTNSKDLVEVQSARIDPKKKYIGM